MSLYNVCFGVSFAAPALLEMLGIRAQEVPRFRDAYLSGNYIVIHTRTGGGNRADFVARNEQLRQLPGFVRDADAPNDCTFANFYYEIPPQARALCEKLRDMGAEFDPAERWQRLHEKLEDPARRNDPDLVRIFEILKPTIDSVAAAATTPENAVVIIQDED